MNIGAARVGLIAALCALPLIACVESDEPSPPGQMTGNEASALADAEAMLDERAPAEPEPAEGQ